MRSSIRSAVLGLLVLGSAAGIAGAQAQEAKQGKRGDRGGMMREGRDPSRGLLRGITLSDAEKASVKTVHEKYQAQFKTLREANKPQREELKAARQRGDTAAVKAIWDKGADQRAKMKSLAEQMNGELRTALTPEHRTQFDTNVAAMKQRMEAARDGSHKGDRAKGGRRAGK
jgi:Spy/CpxP family protein refolding chaperone